MEKDYKRAERRHHLNRLKHNRKGYYGWNTWESTAQELERHKGRVAHTAKLCSCWMCGNPRKHLREKTIQEVSIVEFAKACLADE